MDLLRKIKKSIYGPDFYAKEVIPGQLKSALGYFFSLVLMMALVGTIFVSFRTLPVAKKAVARIGPEVLNRFPADLEVTIKDGKVSTNKEGPVMIPLDVATSTDFPFENVVVIDTKNQFSLEMFRSYKTMILLTETDIFVVGEDQGIDESRSVQGFPDMVINQTQVTKWIGELAPLTTWFVPIIVFLTAIGLFLWGASSLIFLLAAALLIFFFAKLKNLPLTYKQSYQVGLHAVTVSLIMKTVLLVYPMIGVPLLYAFPFEQTLILLVIAGVNLWNLKPVPEIKNEISL